MSVERKMPRRRRYIHRNHALRNELIGKGYIIPKEFVPEWLRSQGYETAADAALERLKGRYNG
jgi:hypothetical protein